jgi:hypothetical protein
MSATSETRALSKATAVILKLNGLERRREIVQVLKALFPHLTAMKTRLLTPHFARVASEVDF